MHCNAMQNKRAKATKIEFPNSNFIRLWWSSGKMLCFCTGDMGSIPGPDTSDRQSLGMSCTGGVTL